MIARPYSLSYTLCRYFLSICISLGILCNLESVQAHERTSTFFVNTTQHVQGNHGLGVREGSWNQPLGEQGDSACIIVRAAQHKCTSIFHGKLTEAACFTPSTDNLCWKFKLYKRKQEFFFLCWCLYPRPSSHLKLKLRSALGRESRIREGDEKQGRGNSENSFEHVQPSEDLP